MKNFIIVIALIIVGVELSASQKKCDLLYKNANWIHIPKVTTEVPGIKITGGLSLANGKESPLYFTEYFLQEAGLTFNNSQPFPLKTYRYHQADKTISWFMNEGEYKIRSHRGGGRDHIINDQALSIKGSGTNSLFSRSNHSEFDINNFRRNGLMLLEDGLITFIIAKQMDLLGMNVVKIPNLVIAPEEIQKITGTEKKPNYIVQLHREMKTARESLENTTQPAGDHHHKHPGVYQLVSDMLMFNIAHGAINPENMGYGAQIIDLGHVSFGYPVMSYSYRCTLCEGAEGGSGDKTLIGILDHYFGNNLYAPTNSRSHSFKLKKDDIEKILSQSVARLNKKPATFSNLSRDETNAFRSLLKEEFKLWGHVRSKFFYEDIMTKKFQKIFQTALVKSKKQKMSDDWGSDGGLITTPPTPPTNPLEPTPPLTPNEPIGDNYDDQWSSDNDLDNGEDYLDPFVGTPGEGDWGNGFDQVVTPLNSWEYMWPVEKSLSYRFLWRVVAQKKYLGQSSYQSFRDNVESLVIPKRKKELNTILNLFENIAHENQFTRADYKIIFQDFIPSNLLKFHIDKMIAETKTYAGVVAKSKAMMTELSKPIEIQPREFRAMVKSLSDNLEKKKSEFMKKAVEEINTINNDNFNSWMQF